MELAAEPAAFDRRDAFLCRSCEQTSQAPRSRCPCCGSFFSFRRANVRVRDLEEDAGYRPYRRGREEYRSPAASAGSGAGAGYDGGSSGFGGTNYEGRVVEDAADEDEEDDEDEDAEDEEDDEESEEEDEEEEEPTLLFEGKAEHVAQDSTFDAGLDHVLDGGLPHGAVVAVVGQPGAGKSTLLRVVSAAMAHGGGQRVLLACPEESKNQLLKARDKLQLQKRFPKARGKLFVVTTKDVDRLLQLIDELKVDLFILDSVDYAVSEQITKNAKVEITKLLCERAHCNARFADAERPVGMFLVHHTTKKGKLMGSNAIVHAVDACIRFDHIDPDTLLLADNQDEGTGYVRLSIYKKIRWASNLSKSYYRVTKSGLVHYDAEAEKEERGARRAPNPRQRPVRARAVPKKKPAVSARGGGGRAARSR